MSTIRSDWIDDWVFIPHPKFLKKAKLEMMGFDRNSYAAEVALLLPLEELYDCEKANQIISKEVQARISEIAKEKIKRW